MHDSQDLPDVVQLYRSECSKEGVNADPILEQSLTLSLDTLQLKLPNISMTEAAARALGKTLSFCTHLQGQPIAAIATSLPYE